MRSHDSIPGGPKSSPPYGAPEASRRKLLRTEEGAEELLWRYLAEGKAGLPSDLKVATLAYVLGIPERTLFQLRRDCKKGKIARRFGGARDQVLSLIGRRTFLSRVCSAAFCAGAFYHPCWALLHPYERDFVIWVNTLKAHGRVLAAGMEIVSYDSWRQYARELMDEVAVNELGRQLLVNPELFARYSIVERVLTNVLTSHPVVREVTLPLLHDVSKKLKVGCNWRSLKPGVLTNLATCMALSDESPYHPNDALHHVYSQVSDRDTVFIEEKLKRIYIDYGFTRNAEESAARYIERVAENIKQGCFSFMPFGLRQAAQTVDYLLSKYPAIRVRVAQVGDEVRAAARPNT